MGIRLSGALAILAMDRFKHQFIYTLSPPLMFYVRYVDDVGTVRPSIDVAQELLVYLNE